MTDYAKMTPEELSAAVAERVMGWMITHRGRRVSTPGGFEMRGLASTKDAKAWIKCKSPEYATCRNACAEALDRFLDEHDIGYFIDVVEGLIGHPDDSGHDLSVKLLTIKPEVLCRAMLQALDQEAAG